jgi:drug/metabolite transporter (DMT)-like permease
MLAKKIYKVSIMFMQQRLAQISKRTIGAWQVAIGSITISFSSVFVGLTHAGPSIQGFYRMFLGGLALLMIAILGGQRLQAKPKTLLLCLGAGVALSLDLAFWHRSIQTIGPGLNTILGNFQVFILIIVGLLFYQEKVKARFYGVIPLLIIGLYLLIGVEWQHLGLQSHQGIIDGFITAVFYALCVIFLRHSQQQPDKLDPVANLALVSFAGALLLGLVVLAQHGKQGFIITGLHNWTYLISYALFGQVIGWQLISKGLPRIPVSQAGLLILLQPALAFMWDLTIFHRHVPVAELIGAVITLGAIYLGSVSMVKSD